eukprot:TRINITY_DN7021_c0_g1_i2.p1 TRINITY_DN7021_c0_g1~~TRINITY_DN7021_c0_g1_i2.p1  ORF type:complete len:102 (-),score=36.75 TRINITY_DN7021_c0_g1_i2:29-334(-)
MPAEVNVEELPNMEGDDYPDGEKLPEVEDGLCAELTLDELKAAFRLFDDTGDGFISVTRFREILKEIDEEFSEDELDGIISDIDSDKSSTIDFNEFVKIMT